MFSKHFCGGTQGTQVSSPIETLKQTSSTLEDKKFALQKKISLEVERAKKFERVTNRQGCCITVFEQEEELRRSAEEAWNFPGVSSQSG